jgi:hypothetical protein
LTKRQEGVRLEGCAQAVFSHGRSPASIAALQRRPPGPRCMSPVERHACARAALGLICRSRRARGLPARALPSSGSGAISWARLQRLYPRIAAQKTKGHGSRSVSMKALRRETFSRKAALTLIGPCFTRRRSFSYEVVRAAWHGERSVARQLAALHTRQPSKSDACCQPKRCSAASRRWASTLIATLHKCAVLPALACTPLPARLTCQVTSHSHLAFISRAANLLAFLLRALALVSG